MQTSLSHDADEAQTNEVKGGSKALAHVITMATLATLVDAAHGVCHAILDEGGKVTTLDEAKEGLQHLLTAIHQGSSLIAKVIEQAEMDERTNAPTTSSLN